VHVLPDVGHLRALSAEGVLLIEAFDRICGKRLKSLIPLLMSAMERHGAILR